MYLFRSSAGDYFCEASNVHGSTAEAVHVDVLYPPECKSLPRTLSSIFFMQSILCIGISFFPPILDSVFQCEQQITLWALLASLARYLTWPLILFITLFEWQNLQFIQQILKSLAEKSAPIGAWECNFPYFKKIIKDRPTDRSKDQQTNRPGHRPVKLQIICVAK